MKKENQVPSSGYRPAGDAAAGTRCYASRGRDFFFGTKMSPLDDYRRYFVENCETRPSPPIIHEIETVAVVLPVPVEWFEFMVKHLPDPAQSFAPLVCEGTYSDLRIWRTRSDFEEHWWRNYRNYEIPTGVEWKNAVVTIRAEVWSCFKLCGARVGVTAHEIFLRLLSRTIPRRSDQVRTAPRNPRHGRRRAAANVIAGPW